VLPITCFQILVLLCKIAPGSKGELFAHVSLGTCVYVFPKSQRQLMKVVCDLAQSGQFDKVPWLTIYNRAHL
jgi:hypothetical protein